MKNTALLLIAVIALGALPARAEETVVKQPQRGFLSGIGVGLLISSFLSAGLSVAGVLNANAATVNRGYYSFYTQEEAPSVIFLENQIGANTRLAVISSVFSGLALAGGIICLAVDAPAPKVAFVPTAEGGVLVLSGRF